MLVEDAGLVTLLRGLAADEMCSADNATVTEMPRPA